MLTWDTMIHDWPQDIGGQPKFYIFWTDFKSLYFV
ncbi:MAG: hypothetical protein ACFIN5_00600 [Candidatus Walczuchella monophlebidarum]